MNAIFSDCTRKNLKAPVSKYSATACSFWSPRLCAGRCMGSPSVVDAVPTLPPPQLRQVKEKTFAATTTTSATHQEQTVLTQEVQKTRKLLGAGDGDGQPNTSTAPVSRRRTGTGGAAANSRS